MAESIAVKKTKKLYDEVLELILERDNTTFFAMKDMEIKYGEAMEGRALELQKLRIEAVRLERRIAYLEAGMSSEDAIVRADYDLAEDDMLYEMQRRVKNYRAALSEDEAEELDEVYTEILKVLHPDLNPDQTLDTATLFIDLTSAYEYCRIDDLKKIKEQTDAIKVRALEELNDEEIKERQKALKASRTQIRGMLEDMLDDHPFDKEDMLDDEDEIAKERANYDMAIAAVKVVIADYEKYLNK